MTQTALSFFLGASYKLFTPQNSHQQLNLYHNPEKLEANNVIFANNIFYFLSNETIEAQGFKWMPVVTELISAKVETNTLNSSISGPCFLD